MALDIGLARRIDGSGCGRTARSRQARVICIKPGRTLERSCSDGSLTGSCCLAVLAITAS
jgi:hypothetical protein